MTNHLFKYFWAYLAALILILEAATTCNLVSMSWILATGVAQVRIADLLALLEEQEVYLERYREICDNELRQRLKD